jgi:hypothetical protein
MKSNVFIASSREAEPVATAIQAKLARVAECTPWTAGVFGLSEQALQSLAKALHSSDFGIFVFAPDDLVESRSQLLSAPRDNVIYEAGMFAGHFGFGRCFIAVPDGVDVKVPSDLNGITLGYYEQRRDKNLEAAVNVFCSQVDAKMLQLGPWHCPEHDHFFKLMAQYECAEWIDDIDNRVRVKMRISDEMVAFCKSNRANKRSLVAKHQTGAYVALAAAILVQPESADVSALLEVRQRLLPTGVAQHKMLDAVLALQAGKLLHGEDLGRLRRWLETFPNQDASFTTRVAALK